ncbi:AAA family ATPase [Micromonospora sp. WMMD1082]|uniref:helix-turn-helix transcriptional regulator n=1 Tax=Micromonospora sp. WMMD1082 TaxID=3016104 RepID=UPI002417AE24|nr:AAA family ATPase [Micromonospora sp. WMMD1082]MDG4795722.1 AAA family ATPase [Micromonospora sp. WMMD1082]
MVHKLRPGDQEPAGSSMVLCHRLIGRDVELARIEELLRRTDSGGGGALLLQGEPGAGKSALLAAATAAASSRRMRVLGCVGAATETHLPYAGLQQALRPVLPMVDQLRPAQRNALGAALGLTDGTVQGPFRVGLATLELLTWYAAERPVLLTVDDIQWLDRSTCDVLAFVARRLSHDPVVMISAGRAQELADNPIASIDLSSARLGALAEPDAAALIRRHAADLPGDVLRRVLSASSGNPLALVELPKALRHSSTEVLAGSGLPLTARLERAFGEQFDDLPADAQAVLAAAALNDGGSAAEASEAAARLTGMGAGVDTLAAAETRGMVTIANGRLSFRHPLVRSAICQSVSPARRREVHAALADVVADPVRRLWHRADASAGPDDGLAAELEQLSTRLLQRGSPATAAAALERAAGLSSADSERGRRLIIAVHIHSGSGAYEDATRLTNLPQLPSDALTRSYLRIVRQFTEGRWMSAESIPTLVEAARRFHAAGATEAAMLALLGATTAGWWGDASAEACSPLLAIAQSLPVPADHPAQILVSAMAEQHERGPEILRQLRDLPLGGPDRGIHALVEIGTALGYLGALPDYYRLMATVADSTRADGQFALLAMVQAMQSWVGLLLGRAGAAAAAAAECRSLSPPSGPERTSELARLAEAMLAARRGEVDKAESAAAVAEAALLRAGAHPLLALVQMVRGTAALATGEFESAYAHLVRIFDPSDIAYNDRMKAYAVVELVESATLARCPERVRDLHRQWAAEAERTGSPHLTIGVAVTAPVLSADPQTAFDAVFTDALNQWPVHRAKVLLAYGRWLRRNRRISESRATLRAAQDLFDALEMPPWSERAAQELRASGTQARGRPAVTPGRLTPQERQIAILAAEGLTNAEIAEKLYLSFRTVRTHLYHIFPKLGVTSRTELATVMSADVLDG